ncbi:MAG: dehalogenase [Deltaproteobacteria bacterium]|nr:dehalogenase [Deltaproteobacteria bacterium]
MGILSGIEILFYILGGMTVLFVVGFVKLRKVYLIEWKTMVLSAVGAFLVLFTIAWSCSSILEGEPKAATMGLLIFGIPALVILSFAVRLIRSAIAKV